MTGRERGAIMLVSSISQSRQIDTILSRLNGVKATGPGKWQALCPVHDDRHPSLSIREAEDGKVLVYCHAGCDTTTVLAALGLGWPALFPAQQEPRNWKHDETPQDIELLRRFNRPCWNAGVRLLWLCRIAENVLAAEGPQAWDNDGLVFWIENIPHFRDLRDALFEGTTKERINALEAIQKWGV